MCLCSRGDCLSPLSGHDRQSPIAPSLLFSAKYRVCVPQEHAPRLDLTVRATAFAIRSWGSGLFQQARHWFGVLSGKARCVEVLAVDPEEAESDSEGEDDH